MVWHVNHLSINLHRFWKCSSWHPVLTPQTWSLELCAKRGEPKGELLKLSNSFLITREHCGSAFPCVRRACDWWLCYFCFVRVVLLWVMWVVLIGLMSIIIEPSQCSTVPGDYLWMADGGKAQSDCKKKNPTKALILNQLCLLSRCRAIQNTKWESDLRSLLLWLSLMWKKHIWRKTLTAIRM